MAASISHLVFVYGTLRRGGEHHHLLAGCPGLGPARTRHAYCMVVDGIPFVRSSPPVSPIQGEMYRVDDEKLDLLDRLERHPVWYRRRQVPVVTATGREIMAWLYFADEETGEQVPDGDYSLWLEQP
ncbi:MAG: gamma-glutamylcyclotransferase [Acidobacteria bacterium]|nr:gamma-glutamylcyclotransferase [Acidobacteriota bacterium]